MFKKYVFEWQNDNGQKCSTDFYVHSKGTGNGFMHRACAIGPLPRIDDMDNSWKDYEANEKKLNSSRIAKVSYINRTWESYKGQTVLVALWDKLSKLKFLDMSRIFMLNPFEGDHEPKHEDIPDPETLFGAFSRR